MRSFRLLAGAALWLSSRVAPAGERSSVVLEHVSEAKDCPAAEELRGQVRSRLGYDAFVSGGGRVVRTRLVRTREAYVATLAIVAADGSVREREPLVSKADTCAEVAASLALAISVAIDPLSLTRPSPPVPSAPDASPESPHAVTGPAPGRRIEPEPERRAGSGIATRLRLGAGFTSALGELPDIAWGPSLHGGVTRGKAALSVEGRYDFSSSMSGPQGSSIRSNLLLVSLVPCFEPIPFALCGLVSAGSFHAEGDGVDRPRTQSSIYWASGLRLGAKLRLAGPVHARATVDGQVPLGSTTLEIVKTDVWTSPPVFVSVGLALFADLPL